MRRTPGGLRAWQQLATVLGCSLWATLSAATTAPLVFVFGPAAPQQLVADAQGQPGTTGSIPLTLNPNGQTGFAGQLQSLAIAGPNAADFAIVPGGSCVPGTTVLFPQTMTTGSSCTVNVRYTPSTTAIETASLTASCTTVGLVGGFSIVCNSLVGSVAGLVGRLSLPVPALSPGLLTGLATTLFALGAYASLRRSGPRRV